MVANPVIVINKIGVRAMSSGERLVLVEIPGFGIFYNELPRIAQKKGFDVASLARAADVTFKTAQRAWNNEMIGITFEALGKLLMAVNEPFDQVFPLERHSRYFNPFAYMDGPEGDL